MAFLPYPEGTGVSCHKVMKVFRIIGFFSIVLFMFLFSFRLGFFKESHSMRSDNLIPHPEEVSDRVSWMNIFQGNRKIGFSHSLFLKKSDGYSIKESVFMRINTLGMVQDVNLKTEGALNPDFTLSTIHFEIISGLFSLKAEGKVTGDMLSLKTESSGVKRSLDIKLKKKPYLVAGILDAVRAKGVKIGDTLSFDIFDPTTMGQETVTVNVISKENIVNMDVEQAATRISLNFKGAIQQAWIGEDGEVLKEEGLLGIILEKTTREDAIYGLPIESSQDLTKVASVESNMLLENPDQLNMLKIELSALKGLKIDGGRQIFKENILTVNRESLTELHDTDLSQDEKSFLQPTLFIQSDNEKIQKIAKELASEDDPPLEKAEKIMEWLYKNIEKRPVLSMPDAISTLENKMGDCNEHAVLFAALARASNIPAKIEAGLVYLNGRFYYHAWNLLYLGNKWITADSVFGQIPADVTHIRFASGEQEQLDMMGLIGKIKLNILEKN